MKSYLFSQKKWVTFGPNKYPQNNAPTMLLTIRGGLTFDIKPLKKTAKGIYTARWGLGGGDVELWIVCV